MTVRHQVTISPSGASGPASVSPFAQVESGSERMCATRSTPEKTTADSYSSRTRASIEAGAPAAYATSSTSIGRRSSAVSQHARVHSASSGTEMPSAAMRTASRYMAA